jgi:hypothetical protein
MVFQKSFQLSSGAVDVTAQQGGGIADTISADDQVYETGHDINNTETGGIGRVYRIAADVCVPI